MQINFHSLLWSYLPRVPVFLAMTVYYHAEISLSCHDIVMTGFTHKNLPNKSKSDHTFSVWKSSEQLADLGSLAKSRNKNKTEVCQIMGW